MKLSVSVTAKDVELLDEFVEQERLASRSAGVQRAIRMLGTRELEREYDDAFAEWDASADKAFWDQSSGAGIADAAW